MRRSLSILVLVVAVAGCAVSTPVQPTATGHSGFDGAVYPGETTALEKSTPGAEQFLCFSRQQPGSCRCKQFVLASRRWRRSSAVEKQRFTAV